MSSLAALLSTVVCAGASRAAPAPTPAPAPVPAPAPAAEPARRLTLTERRPMGAHGRWFVAFEEQAVSASSRGAADVDCRLAQFRIAKFTAFEGPAFTGAVLVDLGQRTEWRSPEPGTIMARVLAEVCGPEAARAPGAADPPAPPRPEPAQTLAPPAASAAAGSAFWAQLASLPSADAARSAWDALARAAPGLLDARRRRLTVAVVHGRRVYRVLAGGFGSRTQAETVCKAVARLSARCFVRPGGAA